MSQPNSSAHHQNITFPNFCSYEALFPLLLIACLLALMVSLSYGAVAFWGRLGNTIFNYTAITVFTSALLCLQKRGLGAATTGRQVVRVMTTAIITTIITSTIILYVYQIGSHNRLLLVMGHVLTISMAVAILMRQLYLRQQQEHIVAQNQTAQLQALQARIQPHFLFNCLNNLSELITSDPKTANKAVYAMSHLFRASFTDSNQPQTLKEELELTQQYLFLEKIRLDDRLTTVIQSPAAHQKIPLMQFIIQPIVENAITHGIEPSVKGGTITITTTVKAKQLVITVANTVSGQPSAGMSNTKGNHYALDNIKQRLAIAYHRKASLSIASDSKQTVVIARIPLIKG